MIDVFGTRCWIIPAGTGTRLTIVHPRIRTGQVAVWLTLRRDTGRGERSSGLTFDLLIDTPDLLIDTPAD